MPELDNIVARDEWRTLHRVLPKDLKDEVCRFEDVIGREIGRSISLGAAVDIWSILVNFLRDHESELIEEAKIWKDSGQVTGTASRNLNRPGS